MEKGSLDWAAGRSLVVLERGFNKEVKAESICLSELGSAHSTVC